MKTNGKLNSNDLFPAKMHLVFVSDNQKGFSRKKNGKSFSYFLGSKKITSEKIISRIKHLAIPPAWIKVWICEKENGHLQATGFDFKGRKQYRYHEEWNKVRNEQKFDRLLEFGKSLPRLRKKIEEDISRNELSQEKVLATVIKLMERTYIRIGNSVYEKENGSYGLTTLKDKHVNIRGDMLKLSFVGKKGIHHSISLKSKRLARIVKQCRDIRGKELFQYYDHDGNAHAIDSGMVNDYIKKISNTDFTAKDFRTWAGSLNLLRAFREISTGKIQRTKNNKINEALDYVSEKLGNTRAVCKKYYVHPKLITLFEKKSLDPFLKELNKSENGNSKNSLNHEEKILIKILKSRN